METYEETLKKILEIPKFTSKNTLSHTREFLRRLGNRKMGAKQSMWLEAMGKAAYAPLLTARFGQAGSG